MSHPEYAHIGKPETKVIEECSELILALTKAERFGWFSHHPDRPNWTNMDEVKMEMNDVVEAIEKLQVKMREIKTEFHKNDDRIIFSFQF